MYLDFRITKESIVDVEAEVVAVKQKIEGCTQKDAELHVKELFVVSAAKPQLPLLIEDASRPVKDDEDEKVMKYKQFKKILLSMTMIS